MTDDDQQPLTDDPRPSGGRRAESLVLVNTGNGKGKSSAAFGVMLRAIARDWRVAVVQFVKSGDWKVGEEKVGRRLGVEWHALGGGFTWDSDDLQHDIDLARAAWATAAQVLAAGEHELVILDELTYLCTWGWVPTADVVAAITDRATDQLSVLFSDPVGLAFLADRRRVPEATLTALPAFGLSSICNVLAAVKLAKHLDLGPDDVVVTVATDGAQMYDTERDRIRARDFAGGFDEATAAGVFGRWMLGADTSDLLETTTRDRDRIFDLGY
jgi:cob(I)alamin adenosyltransferase